MTGRRAAVRACAGSAVLYGVLLARPLSYLLLARRLERLRAEMPELFDGSAALAAVLRAIDEAEIGTTTSSDSEGW